MDRITELTERLKAVLGSARDIAATAEKENRDFTDDERTAVNAKMAEASGLKRELELANADAQLRKTLHDLGDDVQLNEKGQRPAPAGFRGTNGKSLGQAFVDSDEFAELLRSAPGGQFSKKHRVVSRPVGFERLLGNGGGAKALITGTGSPFVVPDYIGEQVGLDAFARPLTLRQLVTQGTTMSDSVEYVQLTAITNNAAVVAEATSLADGAKPESGFTTAQVAAAVKTIAHWIPITKRALSDAASLRTLIDAFLQYGLEEVLEAQMVSGDGTGDDFTGILSTTGIQVQAWDTNLLRTLRRAKTKVRTVGRSVPTAYVVNPVDVEALDLLTDGNGQFYFGGPAGSIGTAQALWNIPLIESEAVPAGTALVGDWRKAVLWDREQATITMSDSHSDFFVKNLVAVLAEMRAAFGVVQPNAFVSIDLTP